MKFRCSRLRTRNSIFSASVSVKSIDGRTSPLPKHDGHVSVVVMSRAGRTRCRVICISPNLLSGRMLWRARSLAISSRMWSKSCWRCSLLAMSMKSTTMMPPMSRRRSWRAISSPARRFTSRALVSWSEPALVRLPELTSITCRASVCSMMIYAPFLNETVFPNDDLICRVMLKWSKIGSFLS